MNLKQLSLLSLYFITSAAFVHASETERKLARLNTEFESAQEQRIAAVTVAEKMPQWTAYVEIKKRIPGFVNDDFKAFQYAAEEFYATNEGKQVAYWHMKDLALWKMTNYVKAKAANTDKECMEKGIISALYGEDLYVADSSKPIRKKLETELLELVNLIETENKQ